MFRHWLLFVIAVSISLISVRMVWTGALTRGQQRTAAIKASAAGNYKDAVDTFRKLALDPADEPGEVGADLRNAIECLRNLARIDEADDFREAVIAVHKSNPKLLEAAALSYYGGEHYGFVVAGKFERGNKRGGARYVSVAERDRIRSLQLMQQAMTLLKDTKDAKRVGEFYLYFAELVFGGRNQEPWRLVYLSDLSKLPDFEDNVGRRGFGVSQSGAPVDEQGNPIFHKLPENWESSKSDGERWRWLLHQAGVVDTKRVSEAEYRFATFLQNQFDAQTLSRNSFRFNSEPEESTDRQTGIYALHTLADDETLAKLANGIKRFKLPDEFNWIVIYKRIAARNKDAFGSSALDSLTGVYQNRRQFVNAADTIKRALKEYAPTDERNEQLAQIEGNWGQFEPLKTQPANSKASVDFRFRNASKVSFEAFEINIPALLNDAQAYLRSSPANVDWQKLNVSDVGHRLVYENERKYVGAKVASWGEDLKPLPDHFDSRITVTTPLTKAGAYLLVAKLANGNTSQIVVWVSDTVIIKKQLDGENVYFHVADAVTGEPIAGANVDFFGFEQQQIVPNQNKYRTVTQKFSRIADAEGQVVIDSKAMPQNHQWLITTHAAANGNNARLAFLGFERIWFGPHSYDPHYNETKVLAITDRPVYRPEQTVQFKLWVAHAQYDQVNIGTFAGFPSKEPAQNKGQTLQFAGHPFNVQIQNPKGEKIFDNTLTADEYGGVAGELALPKGAMLGVYQIMIPNIGGGSFRVEEYKKPEFEVTVEAPTAPINLGDKITATVKATYYFGAPVTQATVKVKVLRTNYTSNWYPRGDWDWFYGPGYWWFAPDYAWYPGWRDWGRSRPFFPWMGRNVQPPEVVLETEMPIGADGTIPISIDTLPAKELHPNFDQQYSITAEVVDQSRRTIVGTGNVLVARKPFQVYTWLEQGHYRAGDNVIAHFTAQTLDRKPVKGKGALTLLRITYDAKAQPTETTVESWELDTDDQGQARQQFHIADAGQYRLSYKVTDSASHTIEGAYLFVARGSGFDGKQYRFNDIELITEKREYAPGDKVKLLINTDKTDSTVLLFLRPTNGVYLPPQILHLKGKSVEQEIEVSKKDMPNFFVEAITISGGKVHSELREVIVPPEKRVLNVEVVPSKSEYKPGEKANVKVKLTDFFGKPFVGSTVLSVYDKSVDYISGGSNVPEIKEFFWKWRRTHQPQGEDSLSRNSGNLLRNGERGMANLGIFGLTVSGEAERLIFESKTLGAAPPAAPGALFSARQTSAGGFAADSLAEGRDQLSAPRSESGGQDAAKSKIATGEPKLIEPTIRKNFADTAFWSAALTTDDKGLADVAFVMPENLTAWKIKVWAMGKGTQVGQGEVIATTKKDLIVRLQAPRFFTQKDEVVLSANVHNYLKNEKKVTVGLELAGGTLEPMVATNREVTIAAGGEARVDWRVRVTNDGMAIIRMKALTDEDSDAVEMHFPVYIHGMLKTESYTGVVRNGQDMAKVAMNVPSERREKDSVLEVRYSPSLAAAMTDALPYMVEYPYGCTEQTLNRFLPTVITQRILQDMKIDLKEVAKHQTNLNSQEIGDDVERLKRWKHYERNPVFDEAEVSNMAQAGINALASMQISDGGWGWFSGYGEHSSAHTTAVVVHGLQLAKENKLSLPANMLEHGIEWLKVYQGEQIRLLKNAPSKVNPWKEYADNMDAFVYMVLVDAGVVDTNMRDFLYRDRTHLAVQAKAMLGLTFHKTNDSERLAMMLKNIEQYIVEDAENQTAYLRLPANNQWWYWYGSDIEANAYYLKLLSRTNPKEERASALVKYLLNNRRNATYWNSTRDTATCIEAMAEYLKASGEGAPDMTVEVWLDGKKRKDVQIDQSNLFTFDNKLILTGEEVTSGKHELEIRRQGKGPVYFNAYLTNFTLEDFITKAGLEVRVNRKYYKLTRDTSATVKVEGGRGQAADQKVEKYTRTELNNLATLKSGDLVEVELEIDSKNDYEYIVLEDPKAAGFEPMLVRSGYIWNGLPAYMELRDERVCFFVQRLPRGKSSLSYRLSAEIPGQFSALPTKASAMYAPELRGNSDEIKLRIED